MKAGLFLSALVLSACGTDSPNGFGFLPDAPKLPDSPLGIGGDGPMATADAPPPAIDGPFATLPDAAPLPDSNIASGGAFACTIDGSAFTETQITSSYDGTVLGIAANDAGAAHLIVITATVATTGTYLASGGNVQFSINVGGALSHANMTAGSGTLTLTTLTSTHAVGTFSFVAAPDSGTGSNVTVTNGSFDVPLVN